MSAVTANPTKTSALKTLVNREFSSYFATPVAYVFLVIFLVLSGFTTFWLGNWFEANQPSLTTFFQYHPWLYLVLMPAIAMRTWAEERNSGTIELLLTLPIELKHAVLAKFTAAWAFAGVALLLTTPMWILVNYLGEPDNGVIFASYVGSWFMAGAFLAIGTCMSAATRSQVIAFVLTVVIGLLFMMFGFINLSGGTGWWVEMIANLGFITHFNAIAKGVFDVRDLLYFLSVMAVFIYATMVIIEMKKAD
jgi:ABC-2 type transport system permease protein